MLLQMRNVNFPWPLIFENVVGCLVLWVFMTFFYYICLFRFISPKIYKYNLCLIIFSFFRKCLSVCVCVWMNIKTMIIKWAFLFHYIIYPRICTKGLLHRRVEDYMGRGIYIPNNTRIRNEEKLRGRIHLFVFTLSSWKSGREDWKSISDNKMIHLNFLYLP